MTHQNSRKKIVVFATSYLPFIGGAEIAIQEVSRRLCDTHDFYIITARQKHELPKKEIVSEGTIIRAGFGTWFDTWLLPVAGIAAVCKLAFSGEISKPWRRSSRHSLLIWGMDISQGSLAGYFFKMLFPHVPFVLTIQYGYGDARLGEGRMGAIGIAFRRMLRSADAVTSISTYLHRAAERYGYAGVAAVIPNGVDASVFSFQAHAEHAKETDRNQRVIITTSRLVEKNGVDTLIRAVAEVKKKFSSIKCYIIGDGPERAALEKCVKECGLSRVVTFLGSIPYEEIPFYLRKADIFVRASRTEGMGNSFVEAMSVGVPVIGTAVGGIPDIIIDHETGIFCRVDDPVDLAEKILMLLRNDDLARALKQKGRKLVEEKFSWDAIAASYGDLFKKILQSRTRVLVATPLYPPEIGGPATYSKILADSMLDYGVLVRLARFGEVRRLPKVMRHLAYAWRVAWQSRYVDCIYAQDPVSVGLPAAAAAMMTRKRFVMKIVGDYAWEQGMQRFGVRDLLDEFLKKSYAGGVERLRSIQRFTAHRAARIVVPSYYLKKVISMWGIPEEKIMVIPNSCEMPAALPSRVEARSAFKLHDFVIVSAGRLVPWKGFDVLIDAVGELVGRQMPLSLVIIGSGPMERELRCKIEEQGLGSRITLAGSVTHDTMLSYLAAADAFVLNTGYEGFSHALLEAMTMGTPVITTSVGGNPELITDNENGRLVEYNNRDQLRDAIASLVEMSSKERKRLATNARHTAQQFTTERMLRDTAQFLSSL